MARPYPPQIEVKVALLRRGMEQREAARLLGYGRSHFSAALNGLVPMSRPMAERLGALLDLDPEVLLHVEREEAHAS